MLRSVIDRCQASPKSFATQLPTLKIGLISFIVAIIFLFNKRYSFFEAIHPLFNIVHLLCGKNEIFNVVHWQIENCKYYTN